MSFTGDPISHFDAANPYWGRPARRPHLWKHAAILYAPFLGGMGARPSFLEPLNSIPDWGPNRYPSSTVDPTHTWILPQTPYGPAVEITSGVLGLITPPGVPHMNGQIECNELTVLWFGQWLPAAGNQELFQLRSGPNTVLALRAPSAAENVGWRVYDVGGAQRTWTIGATTVGDYVSVALRLSRDVQGRMRRDSWFCDESGSITSFLASAVTHGPVALNSFPDQTVWVEQAGVRHLAWYEFTENLDDASIEELLADPTCLFEPAPIQIVVPAGVPLRNLRARSRVETAQAALTPQPLRARSRVTPVEAAQEIVSITARSRVEAVGMGVTLGSVRARSRVQRVDRAVELASVRSRSRLERPVTATALRSVRTRSRVTLVEATGEPRRLRARSRLDSVGVASDVVSVRAKSGVERPSAADPVESVRARSRVTSATAALDPGPLRARSRVTSVDVASPLRSVRARSRATTPSSGFPPPRDLRARSRVTPVVMAPIGLPAGSVIVAMPDTTTIEPEADVSTLTPGVL